MGDYQNIINTAVEEALMRGMEKERLTNAAKMKELGVDVAVICQVTGLSVEDIEKL